MSSDENPTSGYCGGCGRAIASAAKFCRSCGIDQTQFADPALSSYPAQTAGASALSEADAQATEAAPPPSSSAVADSAAPTDGSAVAAGLARSSPAAPGRGSLLTTPWRTAAGQRRSAAWIYYALFAVGALIVGFQRPAFLLVAILAGLYSTYLFRGGRFVIWFW